MVRALQIAAEVPHLKRPAAIRPLGSLGGDAHGRLGKRAGFVGDDAEDRRMILLEDAEHKGAARGLDAVRTFIVAATWS